MKKKHIIVLIVCIVGCASLLANSIYNIIVYAENISFYSSMIKIISSGEALVEYQEAIVDRSWHIAWNIINILISLAVATACALPFFRNFRDRKYDTAIQKNKKNAKISKLENKLNKLKDE